jgi:nucleotide-binding universal stress UspA family protein
MPDTIIVGVDTRRRRDMRDAIALATRLAPIADAELLVVTVVPPSLGLDTAEREREMTEAASDAASRVAGAAPFDVRAVRAGSPARVLHELAERMDAAAVVIGASLRNPENGWMSGSVAEMLVHGSACPLAIAPRDYAERAGERLQAFGAGFVDSDDARAALHRAARLAARAGAPLKAITVVEPFLYSHIAMAQEPEAHDVEHALEQSARAALERAVADLPAGSRTEPLLIEGSPVPTLTRLSAELDLLVLGSRSYGPADGCCWARCPVSSSAAPRVP